MPETYCERSGKRRFTSEGDARADIRRRNSRERIRIRLTPYRCFHCAGWHVTKLEHVTARKRRQGTLL